MTVTRTALRYHGGKWKLAPWIIGHFPTHRVYVEPYGGAANVLLRKPRCYAEIYNDLNDDVVEFFRVLQDQDKATELVRLLELTPFARRELDLAQQERADTDVERARRVAIRSLMGFGSASVICGHRTGFRANSNRSGTTPAHDWRNYPGSIPDLVDRLQGVTIEHRDAIGCMLQHDSTETLHFVDPPYVHETRSFKRTRAKTVYTHEMSDDDHQTLAATLQKLAGMVVLCGYNCDLYEEMFKDWVRVDKASFADGARPRIESLWLNPAAHSKQQQRLAI